MTTPKSTAASGSALRPTDLDLMLFVDGELDDERAREVEAWLEGSDEGRRKIAALGLGADLLVEGALERAADRADGIADAVMTRIASGEVADAAPEPTSKGAGVERLPAKQGPANDNSRSIWVAAAVAVAAAAAMMIWGRTGVEGPRAKAQPSASALEVPAERPSVEPNEPATPDNEVDIGVEVAAVDFGSQSGAIFYVPSDAPAAGHATAVVWLADEFGGGE